MPVSTAIDKLIDLCPFASEAAAQRFLDTLPPDVQAQLIAAVYIGREHIHSKTLRNDVELSRDYTKHIPNDEYARIIDEKGENIVVYLDALKSCAASSSFNLNGL